MGASFGAYHAANSLFKHPDVIKRCFALSGVYDLKNFMDGMYDDNFYFNNPADYIANLSDPWVYGQLASCDIHLSTGTGPWENSGPTYHFSEFWRIRGFDIRWTTGGRWAGTTGRTGNTRCGNISLTCSDPWACEIRLAGDRLGRSGNKGDRQHRQRFRSIHHRAEFWPDGS
jgi:hypothetical protein